MKIKEFFPSVGTKFKRFFSRDFRKYFLYELKRNLLPILIFTVICSLVYLTSVMNSKRYLYEIVPAVYGLRTNLNAIPAVFLCILCTLVPVMMFSFKMNRRVIDCFYSVPLKREKLYLVKSLVGLIMVFIPYTVSYWLGFIVTATSVQYFNLLAYIPIYFISLPLAVLLFGINAFAFTRANSIHDGILFIGMFACAAAMFMGVLSKFIYFANTDSSYWFAFSPIVATFSKYSDIIDNRHFYSYKLEWLLYLFGGLSGVAGWVGLFISARREKAENAEQVSQSWFGYKTMLPYYIVTLLGMLELRGGDGMLVPVLFISAGVVGYMIYRRTFKLLKTDLIVLCIAILIGLILAPITAAPYIADTFPVVKEIAPFIAGIFRTI